MNSDPILTMIPAYRDQAIYIAAARQAPESEWEALWWQLAVAPRWADWAAGQFNEARTREQMKTPITGLDELSREVELLAESGIERLVEVEMARIMAALPPTLPERAICIFAADPQNSFIRQHGVVGSGVGDNILLQVNPLAQNWTRLVPFVLAHEYHHAIWGYNYFAVRGQRRMDLLTNLIIEGQADSFAAMLYPDARPSWIRALSPVQEAEQWAQMQAFLDDGSRETHERFFFGDGQQGTPANAGYTIGYQIVQAYLRRHPGCAAPDLLDLDAPVLLAESGYPQ